jgi:hypothetical protein
LDIIERGEKLEENPKLHHDSKFQKKYHKLDHMVETTQADFKLENALNNII